MNWETQIQIAVTNYLKLRYPDLLWTATCGGLRTSWKQAKYNKLCGYRKGCPDILIFQPVGVYHGLHIEIKTNKTVFTIRGKISPEQNDWIEKANANGYKAVVCYGAEDCIRTIDGYMKGEF